MPFHAGLRLEGKGEAGGSVGDQLPVSGLLVNVSPNVRVSCFFPVRLSHPRMLLSLTASFRYVAVETERCAGGERGATGL